MHTLEEIVYYPRACEEMSDDCLAPHIEECCDCDGTGKIDGETCDFCDGTGEERYCEGCVNCVDVERALDDPNCRSVETAAELLEIEKKWNCGYTSQAYDVRLEVEPWPER